MTKGRARGARRRPSQTDIARMAGVSQTTVSLILSGNKSGIALAESTRRRVLEAAEELGYAPDLVATRMAAARNDILGLYTFTATFPTDIGHSYYPSLVGVEEAAAAQGQDVLLFTGSVGRAVPSRPGHVLRRVRVADGCLFLGRHIPEEELEILLDEDYPFVHIGRRDELGGRIPYIGADYVVASAQLVQRLVALGHSEIRYVRERDDAPASTDREAGVLRGATAAGLSTSDLVVRADGAEITAARVRGWIDGGVSAVITEETDTGAVFTALTRALDELGVRCPEELSLAILGAPPASGWRGREIGGFTVPRREMGSAAVRLLVDLVNDTGTEPHQQLLACRPVEGDTIAELRG
ncbi:LacI family DNA-binding transcriptional regulator [Allokutzneria oryzae]|uniref:LacI family DNA-binding transcriptional regulator n=1 Tax=Allokutzneria oryzae TaxID=1378989 RepID=A0ABV5ZRW2_9PSEU